MSEQIFWLASYPKSGNTWTRSFIKAVLGIEEDPESDIDINHLATGQIASSREWVSAGLGFDISELSHDEVDNLRPAAYRFLNSRMQEPGYHKVHDAFTLTPKGEPLFPLEATRGALYIVRNPLDVAVSFANHMNSSIDKSLKRMGQADFSLCGQDRCQANQLRQWLFSWSEHVRSWQQSGLPVKLVRYEDMRQDPLTTFTGIAEFLALPSDEQQVSAALKLCDFERLKEKEQTSGFREKPARANSFFRKGMVGDWKGTLTEEQVAAIISDHRDMMIELGYEVDF